MELGNHAVWCPGSRQNAECGMWKVKCGMDRAEICCEMVCKVRNAESQRLRLVLLSSGVTDKTYPTMLILKSYIMQNC